MLLDNFRRQLFVKQEIKKLLLLGCSRNKKLPNAHRYYAVFTKSNVPKLSALVKQRNRCVVTGRYWSTLRATQQSRFVFRSHGNKGSLPGLGRSSW